MIYVTGDTHAEWQPRFGFHSFPEGRELTKRIMSWYWVTLVFGTIQNGKDMIWTGWRTVPGRLFSLMGTTKTTIFWITFRYRSGMAEKSILYAHL